LHIENRFGIASFSLSQRVIPGMLGNLAQWRLCSCISPRYCLEMCWWGAAEDIPLYLHIFCWLSWEVYFCFDFIKIRSLI
jgi:hypothetical protein